MAIEVRIPTILRTYTDGAKAVEGQGTPSPTSSRTWRAATPASGSGSSTATSCAASSTST